MPNKFPVSQPCLGIEEVTLVTEALRERQLTMGPWTALFEQAFADYLGVREVVVTTSGTTALHLALAAIGVGHGDEVLVPDVTFVATANAVTYTGARPVLVDVDPHTWCMSPDDAVRKVTARTKAVIPVHLYGTPSPLIGGRAMPVIEDAAEGLGGYSSGKALGTLGDAGVFSFYANKVLTTGEGGAVVTDDRVLAKRLRFLRGQGMDPDRRYYHSEVGFNYRMTDLQAALGYGQMRHLEDRLACRRKVMAHYERRLCYYGTTPHVRQDDQAAPWLFTLQLRPDINRDHLMRFLSERGIETRPTFVPLHRLPAYAAPDRAFPISTLLGELGVSLPTYPELTEGGVDEICDVFKEGVRTLKYGMVEAIS